MKKRLAIIGFNDVGKFHCNELRRSDEFDLVGVYCQKNSESFGRIKIYSDLNELFESADPEAIIITDGVQYLELFSKCVKTCKHIFIHHPIAKNTGAIHEMKYYSNLSGVMSVAGFFDRFNPVIVSLKKSLEREEKIYSINITRGFCSSRNLNLEILQNIDLARFVAASDIAQFSKFEVHKEDKKNPTNTLCQLKMKNQTLVSIHNSINYPIDRFIIEVSANSGIYFGDLIGMKLNKYTDYGQQNLKVDSDISPIKKAHLEFFELCKNNKINNLASLDDALKVYEICV